jgi:hypothetical protein
MGWLFRRHRSVADEASCQLSHEQLGQLFPFHARLNAQGQLRGLGPSLDKLGGRMGCRISALIELTTPPELSFEQLLDDPDLAFGRPLQFRCKPRGALTEEAGEGLELSGELVCLSPGDLLLILSPRVDTVAELNAAGLSTNDLALHDGLRSRLLTSSMEAGLHELVEALRHQSSAGN